MKKLKQAIAYFEDAIRESDEIIAECSEALQKELTEQKKHFEVALKIMKKWNRERECKYCKNPSDPGDMIRRWENLVKYARAKESEVEQDEANNQV